MKEKKKGLLQRGIMVAVSALTIVAGAGTVLAYEAIPSSDESFSDVILDDSINILSDNDINYTEIEMLDFSNSNNIFVGVDGIQITYDDSASSYALCTHSMVPASFFTHAPNSSGGCTVKVYSCQKCEKCGYRANAKYKNTVTFAVCPH